MKRTKVKPYWLIKEDLHEEEVWRRQNRRVRMRLHYPYRSLRLWSKTFILHQRPYYGLYKIFDKWNKLVKTIK